MKCPACFGNLESVPVGDMVVDICHGGCGGIWFDAFELQRVDEESEKAGETLLDIVRNPSLVVDKHRKRECPRCPGIKLKRHFFSATRKVEVDQCPNCAGYWLDHGELMAIRAERQTAGLKASTPKDGLPGEVIRYLYRVREKVIKR